VDGGVRIDLTLDCANATRLAAFWVAGMGGAEERWARITREVDRLAAAGATVLQPFPGHHVVMADPEGNEFCVC
jgi:hypothetical protein